MKPTMTYRKLVMPGDENPAKRLFGGRLMQWADEAAALFAMCQMRTSSIVTLKMSEVLFKNPAVSGDILEFWTKLKKVGRTSITVECIVARKILAHPGPLPESPQPVSPRNPADVILSCDFTFVAIGTDGRPVPHGLPASSA
jgi:acyl-CoA hydrolase